MNWYGDVSGCGALFHSLTRYFGGQKGHLIWRHTHNKCIQINLNRYWTLSKREFTNLGACTHPRHSMTTRFLLSCISSLYYDGEHTLDDLHQVIADDATKLYESGILVALQHWRIALLHYCHHCYTTAIIKLQFRWERKDCTSYAWEPKEIGYIFEKNLPDDL